MVKETQGGRDLNGNHSQIQMMIISPWLVFKLYLTIFLNLATFIKPFGRPGGGAPRRTNSGTLQTSIVSDPATRFQRPFKKDVDHVMVYMM